jgi:hypothetical protein
MCGRVHQPAFGAPVNCADAAAFVNCQRDVEFGSYFCVYRKLDLASKFAARADKVNEGSGIAAVDKSGCGARSSRSMDASSFFKGGLASGLGVICEKQKEASPNAAMTCGRSWSLPKGGETDISTFDTSR